MRKSGREAPPLDRLIAIITPQTNLGTSMAPPRPQTQEELQPEGHEVANVESDGSLTDRSTLLESYKYNSESQSAVASPSNPHGFERYDSDFDSPDPEPMASLTSYVRQNDSYRRIGNSTHEAPLLQNRVASTRGKGPSPCTTRTSRRPLEELECRYMLRWS